MSGLRERQKELRKQAIAKAAIELFQRQGFQDTTVEQIAAQAGVSAPTVFKYFGSKQEMLLEMIREADRRAVEDVHTQLPEYDDPVDTLCHLESLLVGRSLEMLPAALWKELLPLVLTGNTELPETYRQLNATLQAEIASVLGKLQQAGKLRPELDLKLAAFMLNDYAQLQLLRLTSSDTPDLQTHRDNVRATTRFMFEGMRNPPVNS
ncbi:TetR/AcrR family transcriptional regulator [uncultured Pseudomonas sp.]|uniref:TetR/AcrR family transcriptional regulator n=1 Tax=uncultured Pseudomonas sp. TaxID=114707 RepID=UPI0025DA460A|nr:TetR/AcrR family transcriptional regulator [uncultured Pseudomonas sp.]